jgi:hypothetical protein
MRTDHYLHNNKNCLSDKIERRCKWCYQEAFSRFCSFLCLYLYKFDGRPECCVCYKIITPFDKETLIIDSSERTVQHKSCELEESSDTLSSRYKNEEDRENATNKDIHAESSR